MPTDRSAEPWPEASFNGFPGGGPTSPDPPPASAPPAPRRANPILLIGGVAGALALGLLFGLWARPELIGSRPTPPVEQPLAKVTPDPDQIPLTINPPAEPEPLPRAPGRLETLPPEMAAAARRQILPQTASGTAPTAPAAPPTAAPPGPQETADASPIPSYQASFECATARPGAEEKVCADGALAAADRQMARAYRQALIAGADAYDLRQQQRDWLAAREAAALHSRQALAQVYDQRIAELNQIADAASRPADRSAGD